METFIAKMHKRYTQLNSEIV